MKPLALAVFLSLAAGNLSAFDVWQYPQMADKHAIFLGGFPVRFSIEDRSVEYYPPEFYLDYLLPVGLPFSAGVFVNSLGPDIFSFGVRPAYHINLGDANTDVYVLYVLNLIFSKKTDDETVMLEFGGRIGFRRKFGDFICICVETGFKLETIYVGIALKCN